MTKYVCSVCKRDQYTADPYSKTPCIYCGEKVELYEKQKTERHA